MHCSPLSGIMSACLLVSLPANAQNFIGLDFSHNVQATNAMYPNNSTLGPEYFSGLTLDFVNVAYVDGFAVDARVTVLGTTPGYDFVGYIPDYNQAAGQPEGDLGVYYRFNGDYGNATGGIAYTISFYQGGGSFNNSTTLSDVGFLIYDHDGESTQSEHIRTYVSDGLVGYQLGDISGINAVNEGDTWRFDARGANHPEDNADGAFIAYYQNASTIRFDMFSTTTGGPVGNYGIFAAFDGDLSLTGGGTSGFGGFTPIPEPSVPMSAAAALSLFMLHRRRSRG